MGLMRTASQRVIRETIVRAAEHRVECTFVANHLVPVPKRNNIHSISSPKRLILQMMKSLNALNPAIWWLPLTFLLADEVITKVRLARFSSRGELYTKETIKARLNIRDFMDTMRSSGIQTGGPSTLSQTDRREFATSIAY